LSKENLARRRDRARKRYAEDSEYRRKMLEDKRAYRAAHRDKINERSRRKWATDPDYRQKYCERYKGERGRGHWLKFNYGISLEDYNAMLMQQNGACAICKKKPNKVLCVDHCHTTGVVRGLLCRKCNLALGLYDHEPRHTETATAYLRRACSP
jgi:hypothetical protein